MRTKMFSLLLVSLLLVFLPLNQVQAEVPNADAAPCRYDAENVVKYEFSLSGGTANCFVRAATFGDSGTASLIMILQYRESENSAWDTLRLWSTSGAVGSTLVLNENRSVTQGYDYRLYVRCIVRNEDGSMRESVSRYSQVISY